MRIIRVHVPKLLVNLKAAKDTSTAEKIIDAGAVTFDDHKFIGRFLIIKIKENA